MHYLFVWLIWSAAMLLTPKFVKGFEVSGVGGAIVVALLFGVLNTVVGGFLYLLIGLTTAGWGFALGMLTRWFVTAVVLKLTAAMSKHLTIQSFGTAMMAAASVTVLGGVGEFVLKHLGR